MSLVMSAEAMLSSVRLQSIRAYVLSELYESELA